MHEMSVAAEVLRMCRQRVTAIEGARLESVTVAIGELSAIEPDLLQFAWEALTSADSDPGAARLIVEWRLARQACTRCGDVERPTNGWHFRCPRCDGPLAIEGGDDLEVLRLTVATGAPVASGASTLSRENP